MVLCGIMWYYVVDVCIICAIVCYYVLQETPPKWGEKARGPLRFVYFRSAYVSLHLNLLYLHKEMSNSEL